MQKLTGIKWLFSVFVALIVSYSLAQADFGFPGVGESSDFQTFATHDEVQWEWFRDLANSPVYGPYGRSVGMLEMKYESNEGREAKAYCTGTIISPKFLITNYHCIIPQAMVEEGFGKVVPYTLIRVQLIMDYLDDDSRKVSFELNTNPVNDGNDVNLDFAILEFIGSSPWETYGSVPIKLRDAVPGEDLFIIHHSDTDRNGGDPKRITRKSCSVLNVQPSTQLTVKKPDGSLRPLNLSTDIPHFCDSLVGSSGSLVFARDGSIVGLNFAGTENNDVEANRYNLFVRIKAIEAESPILRNLAVIIQPVTVTRNDDWTPVYKQDAKGITMVQVPAGSFVMGSSQSEVDYAVQLCNQAKTDGKCEHAWFEDELNGGMQEFTEPFWIDETEVTRADYNRCVDDGVCTLAESDEYSSSANQPVNNVTWQQAAEFCSWRGATLPTEAEWEYAARGPSRRIFPWGDTIVGNEANHCDSNCVIASWAGGHTYINPDHNDGYAVTAPVGSYHNTAWIGAKDMAGNLWEWTRTKYQAYPYMESNTRNLIGDESNLGDSIIVIRGGAFLESSHGLRSTRRLWHTPGPASSYIAYYLGFRCARSNTNF